MYIQKTFCIIEILLSASHFKSAIIKIPLLLTQKYFHAEINDRIWKSRKKYWRQDISG